MKPELDPDTILIHETQESISEPALSDTVARGVEVSESSRLVQRIRVLKAALRAAQKRAARLKRRVTILARTVRRLAGGASQHEINHERAETRATAEEVPGSAVEVEDGHSLQGSPVSSDAGSTTVHERPELSLQVSDDGDRPGTRTPMHPEEANGTAKGDQNMHTVEVAPPLECDMQVEERTLSHNQDGAEDHRAPINSPAAPPNAVPIDPVRTPRPYRPRQRAPNTRQILSTNDEDMDRSKESIGQRALQIEVRLQQLRGGVWRLSLLPQRQPSFPTELKAYSVESSVNLVMLQDVWYQDVILQDMGNALRTGIEWHAMVDGEPVRWLRTGRKLFVLRRHDFFSGQVSSPRLQLDEDQTVLCTNDLLPAVRNLLEQAGAAVPQILSSTAGIPDGWTALRGVRPKNPVPAEPGENILNVLRPRANLEIALIGGIRVGASNWLQHHPPRIELKGTVIGDTRLLIDGKQASQRPDGGLFADGWDAPGEHQIWCQDRSRTYAIERPKEDWLPWPAHGRRTSSQGRWSLSGGTTTCGALVLPPPTGDKPNASARVFHSANPLLIGRVPGQIYCCPVRTDVRTDVCLGTAEFDPVWAMPADVLHCDKSIARVRMVGRAEMTPTAQYARDVVNSHLVATWWKAILDGSRKGVRVEPDTREAHQLWDHYKRVARSLRRSFK